jgi:hypothetical protein
MRIANENKSLFTPASASLRLALAALVLFAVTFHTNLATAAAVPPPQQNQGAGFLGQWCAQSYPTKQASISGSGAFFTLTNETGDSSPGNLQGGQQNVMVAPGWQFVQGTLTPDGSRINWSNGTFWARCNNGGGGGGGGRRPNIDGTWYRGGNRSQACYIRRRGNTYRLTNEANAAGTGSFDSRRHLTTNWSGTVIGGTVTVGGDRINWDNGTFWTR